MKDYVTACIRDTRVEVMEHETKVTVRVNGATVYEKMLDGATPVRPISTCLEDRDFLALCLKATDERGDAVVDVEYATDRGGANVWLLDPKYMRLPVGYSWNRAELLLFREVRGDALNAELTTFPEWEEALEEGSIK